MTPEVSRNIVVRICGEEVRRYYAEVVVEIPEAVTDEQIERLWLRNFDGIRDLDWAFDSTTGIWPSNCGRRIQPQVMRTAQKGECVAIRLLKTPKGSLVVEVPEKSKRPK